MRNLYTLVILMLALTACGKKGPLHYPDMLVPSAPGAVTVSQSGSAVKLQFVLPDKDRGGRKLSGLAGVKISKRQSDLPREQLCNSCLADYFLFRKLDLGLLPEEVQRFGSRIVILDGDVSAGKTYSYSLVPFAADGSDGSSSNPVAISPVTPTPAPVIKAESFPTEIKVSFTSLPSVGRFVGYNIYRRTQQGTASYLPLNREPFAGMEYIDSGLARNTVYSYTVRSVVKLENGDVVESLLSNAVEGMLKDDE
ncbi:MAG: hypothetical protein HY888_04570 [Deltaproteobacteria bacterium]|nr:hypothetical protein [Deltaproteobacteria bacterium]